MLCSHNYLALLSLERGGIIINKLFTHFHLSGKWVKQVMPSLIQYIIVNSQPSLLTLSHPSHNSHNSFPDKVAKYGKRKLPLPPYICMVLYIYLSTATYRVRVCEEFNLSSLMIQFFFWKAGIFFFFFWRHPGPSVPPPTPGLWTFYPLKTHYG